MDRRVVIQSSAETTGDGGGLEQTWSTVATVWAGKEDSKGREFFAANQEIAERATRFRIRYRSGVTEKMRVSLDGRTYDIESIEEIGRREGLWLYCVARPA